VGAESAEGRRVEEKDVVERGREGRARRRSRGDGEPVARRREAWREEAI